MDADLLTLARGPALAGSLIIMLAGIFWRLAGVLLLRRKPDYSEPRSTATVAGALELIVMRSWPRKEFAGRTMFNEVTGYAFHIGLFIVIFGYGPHIQFFKDVLGFGWPALPNGLVYLTGAITVGVLIAVVIRRMANPVLRLISNFDDYFSWFVTVAPVATGMLAFSHLGGPYQTLLAIHILSVELLFVWLPFGKLMHMFLVFISRGTTGALFTRKGASI